MTNYLTKEGLAELKAELKELKTKKLPEVLDSLSKARAEGDLSENAAYDVAKSMQEQLQNRIAELEDVISDHKIIKAKIAGAAPKSTVEIGDTIELEYINLPDSNKFTLTIVGASEANAINNRVSNESPVAQATMHKRVGDTVKFMIRGNEMEVKILKIK